MKNVLKLAINYKDELIQLFREIWFEEKYKYYGYRDFSDIEIFNTTENSHQFVSVDSNGKVIGYINYKIDRVGNCCNRLGAINFSDDKITFGCDLHRALKDIFDKYNFRKLNFEVIVGNPAESQYDRIVEKMGGRIVGVYKEEAMLYDGLLYDDKVYEVFKKDYKAVGYASKNNT